MTLLTRIERILPAEDRLAEDNAALLQAMGIVAVHLLAPPGAGKTHLILRTAENLAGRLRLGVVQASLSLPLPFSPLEELDLPCVQVHTGGRPGLDASMFREALEQLPLADLDLLLIEDIGTLVLPPERSLGATRRAVVTSLPEGEDCASRYPEPFAHADAIVLNKLDLLSALDFDRARFRQTVRRLNPTAPLFEVSCRTGEGLEKWVDWLQEEVQKHRRPSVPATDEETISPQGR
ncbi:MAG: hydrogenase nickel incorporation protein HypB [Chloroflexia bacterium]